ncbi:hypothetical protein OS493_032494 [Desmophyllum pertusum]|uniref:Uncharacterized protein n=1 Tax=Desmophyllum pertusum TaxID=174260 RepID=A0A9X0D147_9CNID|nr:hypothetical protein OS493_032494 [Desmophyllum pertusum]
MGKTGIKVTCVQPFTTNTGLVWHPKSRFPSLYPVLEPEYVAKRQWLAHSEIKQLSYYRPAVLLNFMLAGFLPVKATLVLVDFLKVGLDEHIPSDEKKSD